MSRDVNESVIAVVGASGGLGAPIARALHRRGARVVLAGRSADRLALPDLDDAPLAELDMRDSRAGDRLLEATVGRLGRLDGVVNAAGIVAFGSLVDTDDIVIEELFLTNVLGPLWMMRRVLPALATTKGFMVNISAVVAEQPLPGMAAYAASKAALTAADGAVAREARRLGVHVCDVRPPHTETDLARHPVAGTAPKLPTGLSPEYVAERIVLAVERDEHEVSAAAFQPSA